MDRSIPPGRRFEAVMTGQATLDEAFPLPPDLKSRPPGGAVGLVAGGRVMTPGADILLLDGGFETEAVIVFVRDDGTIQALPGPDVLLGNYPARLDHLEFGADWRWPSAPTPSTAA
jgi:hypothetical protein